MGASIVSVATALPEHKLEACEALARLRKFFPRLDKFELDGAALGSRYLCEPIDQLLERRGMTATSDAYRRHAACLALRSASLALERAGMSGADVDMVITVSCTGYLVPSLDVHISEELGLRPDVIRLPITELGCSAGAAGISAARRHLAGFPGQRVLVVAVEIPSLSFQEGDRSADNLTACLVFGDGAGAAVVGAGGPLELVDTASHLVPRTSQMLGFDLRDDGFHVVLDRRLTSVVRDELAGAVRRFMPAPDFYAVHAAGPRIFAAVEAALALRNGALDVSRKVFAEVGNTSSAAIFFVLEKLLRDEAPKGDGLGLGIGPGVTFELMHLRRT